MEITLDHIGIITATDEENAEVATFFADVLGLEIDGDAATGYAEVRTGGPTIALHRGSPVAGTGRHDGTLLQFRCDDVEGFVAAARARGAQVAVEPHRTDWGTLSAYLAGPRGILVELFTA